VKTAISLPDDVFAAVERHAQRLGISRSEFFATAAKRYAADLDNESLTDRINAALDDAGHDDDDAEAAAFIHEAAVRMFERDPFVPQR
jgi:metal-responsive CopG/Arc/MetJ family transcriptional regulator